jgi:beta-lactamase regulating signal transducer with metallopeptidase domain
MLSLATLLALLVWQGPALWQGVWLACQDAAAALTGYLPALGLALPLVLLATGLLRGLWSMLVQLWYTRRLVAGLARRRRALPQSLAAMAAELGLAGRLLLVEESDTYTFTQGLWRPRIWLTTGLVELLDEAELRAVLCHERHHLARRDPLRVLLTRSLAQGLFFVPVAPALRDTYLIAKEVEADTASGAQYNSLAAALLKLLRSESHLPRAASLAAVGPIDVTRARIERLVRRDGGRSLAVVRGRHLWLSLLLAVAIVAVSQVSLARTAGPLAGGECGYTTWSQPGLESTPANYTPVDLSVR